MSDEFTITEGSTNVFADLGLPNAKEHFLKAHLVSKIMDVMEERGLTQVQTAEILGIRQPNVSDMLRGKFSRISVEKLLHYLVALGQDVEIVVKPHRDTRQAAQLIVA
jgi:predicted XRE-type DNA-binding protein